MFIINTVREKGRVNQTISEYPETTTVRSLLQFIIVIKFESFGYHTLPILFTLYGTQFNDLRIEYILYLQLVSSGGIDFSIKPSSLWRCRRKSSIGTYPYGRVYKLPGSSIHGTLLALLCSRKQFFFFFFYVGAVGTKVVVIIKVSSTLYIMCMCVGKGTVSPIHLKVNVRTGAPLRFACKVVMCYVRLPNPALYYICIYSPIPIQETLINAVLCMSQTHQNSPKQHHFKWISSHQSHFSFLSFMSYDIKLKKKWENTVRTCCR